MKLTRTFFLRRSLFAGLSLVLIFLTSSFITPVQAQTIDDYLHINGRVFTYKGTTVYLRGTNFNNLPALGAGIYLPAGNITHINVGQADYQKLAQMGANHVRFGLDYQWYSQNPSQFFDVLDQHVAWAKQNGIWFLPVVFVLPGNCYEGYNNVCAFWDNATYMQQLKDFWVDFIDHYANEPAVIGIDVLNEPTVGASHGWQTSYFWEYAKTVRDAVVARRSQINSSSSTLVFISGGSSPNSFYNLGANVVYEEHMYMPSGMTHAAPYDRPTECRSGAQYPGNSTDWGFSGSPHWDKSVLGGSGSQSIRSHFALGWAQSNNVPYYIGEWGVQSACSGWDQYIADVGDILNQNGVHYVHFVWRSNSGNFDTFPMTGALTIQNQSTYNNDLCIWKNNFQPVPVSRLPLPASCAGGSPFPTPTPVVSPTPQASPQTSPSTPAAIPGDVNGDGVVNAQDLRFSIDNFAKTVSQVFGYTDQILDGKVNSLDFGRSVGFIGVVQPSPSPTGNYPRELMRSSGDSRIHLIETQAPQGNKVFIKAEIDSSVTVVNVAWFINGSWTTQDNASPYFLGGDFGGTPNGFTFSSSGNQTVRAVVYYNTNQNFIEATSVYSF